MRGKNESTNDNRMMTKREKRLNNNTLQNNDKQNQTKKNRKEEGK